MNSTTIERFRHRRPFRLWICSLISISIALLVIAGLVSLGLGIFKEKIWLWFALGSFGGVGILTLGFMVGSARVNCRVCTNTLLIEKGCNKHRSAKRFLGLSYTLGSSIPAFFTGNYRCMYCGEPNFIWVTNRRIRKHMSAKAAETPAQMADGFTPIAHQNGFPNQTGQQLPPSQRDRTHLNQPASYRHQGQFPPQTVANFEVRR